MINNTIINMVDQFEAAELVMDDKVVDAVVAFI